MPGWREEYLASLQDAALQGPVNEELVQTCSHLADRVSTLEAQKAALQSRITEAQAGPPSAASQPTTANDPLVSQLRVDLAEALRTKNVTEARLRAAQDELARLRAKAKDDARSVKSLAAERSMLTTRLKDREHELREKRKLLEQVQDEMITLTLQMSVAERERDQVKRENKELVDRWMMRVAQEADAMNLANEPLLEK